MKNKHIYYTGVSIENVRTFGKKQNISFLDDNGGVCMWNIIIGDNGIGKTTILKTLSLPLLRPWGNMNWIYRINFNTFERYNPKTKPNEVKKGNVEVGFLFRNEEEKTSTDKLKLQLFTGTNIGDLDYSYANKTNSQILEDKYKQTFLLFAYGASRQIGQKGISSEKEFPAQTLFDDTSTLMNTEEWLLQVELKANANPERFKTYKEKVFRIVKLLLRGEVSEIKTDVENSPKILFKTHFGWVQLHELSLGFKTLLSWIVDLSKGMLEKYPDSENALAEPAICLVDEIDLHIHPSMQKEIIQFLSETFTQTQFIVTTHSPLILQSVENANVILLNDKGNTVEVFHNSLDIQNWRIDQILSSDLFELTDVYPKVIQKKMDKHSKLLQKNKRTIKEEKELQELSNYIENMPIGNNQDEIDGFQLMRAFADKIAKNQKKKTK